MQYYTTYCKKMQKKNINTYCFMPQGRRLPSQPPTTGTVPNLERNRRIPRLDTLATQQDH